METLHELHAYLDHSAHHAGGNDGSHLSGNNHHVSGAHRSVSDSGRDDDGTAGRNESDLATVSSFITTSMYGVYSTEAHHVFGNECFKMFFVIFLTIF